MNDEQERKSIARRTRVFFWCLVTAIALSAIARVVKWFQ
jgi:hypothetical protein